MVTSNSLRTRLRGQCQLLADRLHSANQRLVLAESCTAGLVAATLARIPGISDHLCGSAVTYRDDTKARWLRVSRRLLRSAGAVSAPVARQMALGALARTPEAQLSAAVTGHLGPQAPPDQDGTIFIAVGRLRGGRPVVQVERLELQARRRQTRQLEATLRVVERLVRVLS